MSGAVLEAPAAEAIVRRKPPADVRRRRFLISVADHSLLIAGAIIFLAPFVFMVLTSLMSNEQALSSHLWPHPFEWGNFAEVFHKSPLLTWTVRTPEDRERAGRYADQMIFEGFRP